MARFSARLVALVGPALLLAGACTSGGDGGAGRAGGDGDGAPITFSVVSTDVQAMAFQAPAFPDDVRAAVTKSLDTWLDAGVVRPLRTGQVSSGLEAVFTPAAFGRLAAGGPAGPGTDRAAMLEEGTPLTGAVSAERSDARLTALTGQTGETVLVTAQVDVGLAVRSGDGVVDVVRTGEVVLVPDQGGWRIDAFDVRTSRDTRLAKPK